MYSRCCILGSVFSIWRMVARSRWCTLDAPASSLSAAIRRPLNPSLRPGLIEIASTDSCFGDGIFKTRDRKWTHILETGIDMVHRKGGYKCTHKSQNHRSISLPQTREVRESSKPGIKSCSKWLHASGTGSNMVHNEVPMTYVYSSRCTGQKSNNHSRECEIALICVATRKHCCWWGGLEGKGEKRLQRDNCFPDWPTTP